MRNIRVIFLIAALIAVIIGGFYFFADKGEEFFGRIKKEINDLAKTKTLDIRMAPADYGTLRGATTTPEEIAGWGEFINNRVGWRFRYPLENLTRNIDEIIKFPSHEENQPKNEDLLEFAVGETIFRIRTYSEEGTSAIVAWIKESGKSVSADIGDYHKFFIDGNDAYNLKGKTFAYTLVNKNIYEISAYREEGIWLGVKDEPLFEKWISTISFFPEVRCWERAL
ncbi:MAG: hypothetical protein PHQ42_00530 [Patescibacteria group bacterium]|nr:hypothetical protein [Patescibacteria group bacterium]